MNERRPYLQDADFTLYVGDVREVLQGLPDESVHCVVTSPPYWGLRDYGTGLWEGGDESCDHETVAARNGRGGSGAPGKQTAGAFPSEFAASECGKCGARRVDQQLGLEPTPELYVENMTAVFREVRRVLRRDGTCWLNIGDSYASSPPGNVEGVGKTSGLHGANDANGRYRETLKAGHATKRSTVVSGLKPKDLCGMPWRLAFALQADGWYLRSEIIWAKPNPMPESVTDRPTKSHEQVFLLTRSPKYFFDADAVRETSTWARENNPAWNEQRAATNAQKHPSNRNAQSNGFAGWSTEQGRNLRSVWNIATEPYPDAHFATFPQALVEPCVKAGTSERGCCPVCGAPWERETERTRTLDGEPYDAEAWPIDGGRRLGPEGVGHWRKATSVETIGWRPTCDHYDEHYHRDFPKPRGRWQQMTWWSRVRRRPIPERFRWPVEPCVVADPFLGSGTTALVARNLGRGCLGIELNESYAELAARRNSQMTIFAEGGL